MYLSPLPRLSQQNQSVPYLQLLVLNVEDGDFRDMLYDYRITSFGIRYADEVLHGLSERQGYGRDRDKGNSCHWDQGRSADTSSRSSQVPLC